MLPWGSGSNSMCAVHPRPDSRNQWFQPTMAQAAFLQFVVRTRLCPLHSTGAFGPAATPAAALCLRLAAAGTTQPAMLPCPASSRSAPPPLISSQTHASTRFHSIAHQRFKYTTTHPTPHNPAPQGACCRTHLAGAPDLSRITKSRSKQQPKPCLSTHTAAPRDSWHSPMGAQTVRKFLSAQNALVLC